MSYRPARPRSYFAFAGVAVVAFVSAVAPFVSVRADGTSPLAYGNGPVITTPHVYLDFWGTDWAGPNGSSAAFPDTHNDTKSQVENYIETLFRNIGGSDYLSTLTNYYQELPGSSGKTFISNPIGQLGPNDVWEDTRPVPSPFSKIDVLAEAQTYAIPHFGAPKSDYSAVFMIFTGPTAGLPTDMGGACGYHDHVAVNFYSNSLAFIPYQPTVQPAPSTHCFPDYRNDPTIPTTPPQSLSFNFFDHIWSDSFGHGPLDGFSITGTHEYAEAITDPALTGGWRDTSAASGEIADKCENPGTSNPNPFPTFGDTWLGTEYFAVQGLWNNALPGCQLFAGTSPSPFPSCTAPIITAAPVTAAAVGNSVVFTAMASGCPTPAYRFSVQAPDGSWTVEQDFPSSDSGCCSWWFTWGTSTAPSGSYNVKVEVRDYSSLSSPVASAVIGYHLGCYSASIGVSNGPPVTISGAATCPKTAEYRFWIRQPGGAWTTVQDYSTASTYAWNTTGLAAGTYNLEVDVADQGSAVIGTSNQYEATASTTYTVQPVPGGADFVGNVSADFNGDGNADIAVLYYYGNDVSKIFVWLGNADGTFQAPQVWWTGTSFNGSDAKIVAGDFNGDHYGDLAVIYNYGLDKTGIWVWYGPYSGFQYPQEPWYGSSFNWADSKLTAGDYNGDGYTDLGVLYNYGGSTTGFWWWPGSASGITTNVGLVWKYTTFAWSMSKVTSGDYNADGKDDLAVLYNYGNSNSGIFVWLGTPTGLSSTTTRWWYGSLDWNASKVISGNWNASAPLHSGFGYSAFTVVYNFGSSTGIYVWQGSVNNAAFRVAKALWWQKAGVNWNAMKVTSGNFNGDFNIDYVPYDDLAALYDFGGSDSGILIWSGSPASSFNDPVNRWEGPSFPWTNSQIA